MPREYVAYRRVMDNAMRVVMGTLVAAAGLCFWVVGGFPAFQQFVITFAVMAAVVGLTFMLFMYDLVKFPGWQFLLVGEALLVGCAYVFADDIMQSLGVLGVKKMTLVPLTLIDGSLNLNPFTAFGFLFLMALAAVIFLARRKQ